MFVFLQDVRHTKNKLNTDHNGWWRLLYYLEKCRGLDKAAGGVDAREVKWFNSCC